MKVTKKLRRKTSDQLLERASDSLLAALKKDMLARDGRADYDKLRKEGYSERLLARLAEG